MTGPNTTPDFVRKAYILQYIADGAEIVSLAGGHKLPERLPVPYLLHFARPLQLARLLAVGRPSLRM